MDDRELNELLREWTAPEAPAHLRPPERSRESLLRWLLTGSIRVPVPVGVAAAVLAAFWLFSQVPEPAPDPLPSVSLADFRPVDEVEVRVVGQMK